MSVVDTLSQTHQSLFAAKQAKGYSFSQVAEKIGRSEVWTAALFYGQAKPEPKDIKALSQALEVPLDQLQKQFHEHWFPERGLGPAVPTDATLYRLYEIVKVFGYPLKSVIHEKFGDGIMSAISFNATVDKVNKDGADWVDIHLQGKWLPYSRW